MSNRDVAAAWAYHNRTKHRFQSVRSSGGLDWANQPTPYKVYTTLDPLPLPEPLPPEAASALDAIAAPGSPGAPAVLDLPAVAALLHYSAGITKTIRHPGGEMPFRAASCTGALYHIDLYLVCGNLPGLPAGVYHYSVHDHSLRRLREGDYRAVLVQATAGESAVPDVPYVFAIVQLEEGVRMNTNIVGIEHAGLRIGIPVEVVWDDVTPEITLPKFGPPKG